MEINYVSGGMEIIDAIEELWNMQCDYHEEKSLYFKDKFKNLTFEYRKNAMMRDDKDVNIIIAQDGHMSIGYVISTIKNGTGELFSLYLKPHYRGLNIGEKLMEASLTWMENSGAEKIELGVAVGNEVVLDFYRKFDFYPYVIMMERKK
ncbi:GNAT family N-acetyltransferase [Acidaminobacter sp. JC074]|uniref:GNAT family N-acetyltransferase n=1 Tax=Acidaminobacter sp. JC074 TaxID=2530199 RepID=UPI001F0F0353|nr:GNAT family N-acetyltransferase [Acidaminobacter sp. JC074]MCH4886595.1 GNAT family N-acetyltransferase [Acidaminobacter sp. JC074]